MKHKESSLTPVQMTFEVFVAIGYFMGLTPFMYLIAMIWVIPFTLVNVVLALISNNKTLPFTLVNVLMALLSLIPIFGYFFRIVGFAMSSFSMLTMMKKI